MGHGLISVTDAGVEIIEAMYNRKPAWHKLGKVWMPSETRRMAPNSKEIMVGAHLGWRVHKEAMFVKGESEADPLMEIPDRFATVRENPRAILGVVGSRYTVVQNEDCFAFMDSLFADGELEYESAFALYGGRQVAILARMPSCDEIADDDISLRHILMLNSHDGSGSIQLIPTATRVVCANTVQVAIDNGTGLTWEIRHTASADSQLKMAHKYLSQFDEKFSAFADKGRLLATRQVDAGDRKAYLDLLFPAPEGVDGTPPSATAMDRWEEKTDHINTLFTRGARNNLRSIKGSWWSLFNSVTEYLDHHTTFRGDNAPSNRVESIFQGSHAAHKAKAFQLALTMAG